MSAVYVTTCVEHKVSETEWLDYLGRKKHGQGRRFTIFLDFVEQVSCMHSALITLK